MSIKLYALLAVLLLFSACSAHKVQVDPVGAGATNTNLSHDDFNRLCHDLVSRMMDDARLQSLLPEHSTVVMHTLKNKTMYHLDSGTLTLLLRKTMDDTGRFSFVNQEQMLNARYVCHASLSAIVQHAGRVKVASYVLAMEMTDVRNGELVWTGQADVRKLRKRPRVGI